MRIDRRAFLGMVSLAMAAEKVDIVHTRVFAASPGGGNPCPVIADADGLSDAEMQSMARKFGQDTAFLLRPQSKAADLRIRYFVPDHEMGVSGHATIAAITVALRKKKLSSDRAKVETITGTFEVAWTRRGDRILVTLEQNPPVFGAGADPARAARALGIGMEAIESPIQSVSVSRAKLLVPLKDSRVLDGLKPDFEALWQLCDDVKVTGLYPFTRRTDKKNVDAEARQFPLRAGIQEDAATGVAAAALAAYLAKGKDGHHEFRIAQGYAMGAPSLIEAIAECRGGEVVRTAVRGSAEVERPPISG